MRILSVTLVIVIVDQLTKLLVKGIDLPAIGITFSGLQLGISKPIIGDFLRLTYIENPGMAFGIDFGGKLFFSIFSIVASVGVLFYLYRARDGNLLFRTSLAMILGGAIGNLIDRVFYGILYKEGPLFYGKVVDFIDADFFNIDFLGYHLSRWPVFNIADASVTCGVILMLFANRKSLETQTELHTSSNVSNTIGTSGSEMISAPIVSQDSTQSHSTSSNDSAQS